MTHDAAEPLLLDLVYGELAPDQAREVERHVAQCAACASALEDMRATRRLAARAADEPLPARVSAELRAAARGAVAAPPARRRLRTRTYAIAASAAVVAVVAGVTLELAGAPPLVDGAKVSHRDGRGGEAVELHRPADAPAADAAGAPPPSAARVESAPAKQRVRDEDRSAAPKASGAEPPSRRRETFAERPRSPAREAPPAPSAAAPSRAETPAAAPPAAASRGAERSEAADSVAAQSAPAPSGAARRSVEEGARAQGAREPDAPALVNDIERRAAAGELRAEARRVVCDGNSTERVAWITGARVVKLAIRDARGAVVEGWYDGDGRLRAWREDGGEVMASSRDGAPAGSPPARAPAASEVWSCGW